MPWYPGDYLADTLDLTPMQDLFYRRLLDHCWLKGGPAEVDVGTLQRKVRAVGSVQHAAVKFVLEKYFEKKRDGWHNKRLNFELRGVRDKVNKNIRAGKLSGIARKAKAGANLGTDVERPLNERSTNRTEQNRTKQNIESTGSREPQAVRARDDHQTRALAEKPNGSNPDPDLGPEWKVPSYTDEVALMAYCKQRGESARPGESYYLLWERLRAQVEAENQEARSAKVRAFNNPG